MGKYALGFLYNCRCNSIQLRGCLGCLGSLHWEEEEEEEEGDCPYSLHAHERCRRLSDWRLDFICSKKVLSHLLFYKSMDLDVHVIAHCKELHAKST